MKKHLAIAAALAAVLGATLTGLGSAQSSGASLACPSDFKTQPLGKIYGLNRGTTFCNDRATATAFVGKQRQKLTFAGGVCWKSRDAFSVAIGTAIVGKRLKADPPGFWLQNFKPGGFVKDSVDLGKRTLTWRNAVKLKIAANKKKGTFSGKTPTLVNGKLTYIPMTGSFTCKYVRDAPDS